MLYLEAVENAYLAFARPVFAFSTRKQSLRNKKWYPIDNGLGGTRGQGCWRGCLRSMCG